MSLTSKRFYFDYNATSPFADQVINWLVKGDFLFSNPSSIHKSGRKIKKEISLVSDYLHNEFHLGQSHNLIYHSGATEGINMLIKGLATDLLKRNSKLHFFYSLTDHSAVTNLDFNGDNVQFHPISVSVNGEFDVEKLIQKMNAVNGDKLLNFTWVNNETGVVWPLNIATRIKKETGCKVHIDAVQAPGKIEDWNLLETSLDAYTFSGHKFGSMKGVGFSFVSVELHLGPLLNGGGQQGGLRSGTENTTGILSLKFALKELSNRFNFQELNTAKLFIETSIKELLGDKGEIVAENSKYRNSNTVTIIVYGKKADSMAIAFDLAGIEISTGPACSSGTIEASKVLLAMGKSNEDAKSEIRFSFSPFMTSDQGLEYFEVIKPVLSKFL